MTAPIPNDFTRARDALVGAGFSNSEALDLLVMNRKSLRDQMAMAALPWVVEAQGEVEAAQRAYRYADAMLLARRGS